MKTTNVKEYHMTAASKISKCVVFAAVLLVLACGLASAQNHVLYQTYIDQGYYSNGLPIPAGNQHTFVGPVVNVNCPGTSGTCTIQANQSIQHAGSSVGNTFQIGFYLDGSPAINLQEVGETPSDGSFLVSTTQELQAKVPLGKHTVQIFVMSLEGCSVYNYSTNFQVFKP